MFQRLFIGHKGFVARYIWVQPMTAKLHAVKLVAQNYDSAITRRSFYPRIIELSALYAGGREPTWRSPFSTDLVTAHV